MSSLVSSISWVKRGAAKIVPEKLNIDKDQLKQIIVDLKDELGTDSEPSDDENPRKRKTPHKKLLENKDGETSDQAAPEVETEEEKDEVENENENKGDPYGIENYDDDESDEHWGQTIAGIVVYSDNKEDPYITLPDEDDDEEDRPDFEIKATDNLIVAGRAAPECSLLEVYVFNEADSSLYCHHDIVLPAFPLATEWVNYDVENGSKGNLLAVGSMESTIALWELDVVDIVEPVAVLGEKQTKLSSKKQKQSKSTQGHTDAVLDLSWHPLAPAALASASADETVAVWDLSEGKHLMSLKHGDKVQTLEWHSQETSVLLTGAFDHVVRLYDCRQPDVAPFQWKILGEVERVMWDRFNPFNFFACTDSGHICYMDSRKDKNVIYTLQAHDNAVTGIAQSSLYTHSLITISTDSLLKVWDTGNQKPNCIFEKTFSQQGGLTCLGGCPDSGGIFVIGSEKALTMWDIRESSQVKKHFEPAKSKDVTPIEAMASLQLTVMDSDNDEMEEYLAGTNSSAISGKPGKVNGKAEALLRNKSNIKKSKNASNVQKTKKKRKRNKTKSSS